MSDNRTPRSPEAAQSTVMAAQMDALGESMSQFLAQMKSAGDINMMVAQSCSELARINAEEARSAYAELTETVMASVRPGDMRSIVEAQQRLSQAAVRRSLAAANRNMEWAQALLTRIHETSFPGPKAGEKKA